MILGLCRGVVGSGSVAVAWALSGGVRYGMELNAIWGALASVAYPGIALPVEGPQDAAGCAVGASRRRLDPPLGRTSSERGGV